MGRSRKVVEVVEEQPMLPIAAPKRRVDRAGKQTVSTLLNADKARELRILAAKTDRTLNDLIREAIEDVLVKHNQEDAAR